MKNVLVVYYSQTGQLEDIAKSITAPLQEKEDISLTYYRIRMQEDFPFPWNNRTFFDVFPESFLQVPREIHALPDTIKDRKFDLVILAYQVWFLSPSIPISSFLQDAEAQKLLANSPVVTVVGCRNMWTKAQEDIKRLLKKAQASLVGHIALVDRAPNLVSVITIVRWMFSGKKKKYLGIFPKPGVSDSDIQQASRFGHTIAEALLREELENLQAKLVAQRAVDVSDYLLKTEQRGAFIFNKWANHIRTKKASRRWWLKAFNVYLLLAIWILSPIIYIVHLLTYPFTRKARKKRIAYYQSV